MIRRPPTKLDLKSDEDMKEYEDIKASISGKTEELDLSSNSNILMESHNVQITPSASHHTFNRHTLNTWHQNSTS